MDHAQKDDRHNTNPPSVTSPLPSDPPAKSGVDTDKKPETDPARGESGRYKDDPKRP